MSRNEGAKYDLVSGDVLLAARHDLDCYLAREGRLRLVV